jgi:site-specific DNA-adenine methylase
LPAVPRCTAAPAPVEVLNDINGDLVTLYRVVQTHLKEFVRRSNGR